MRNSFAVKSLSLVTSVALVFASCPVGAAPMGMPAMPDFIKALTPPESLGFVDSYYQGQTEHPILLVQDLHANYGVQQKIEGLLKFYQPKLTEGGHKLILGVEGAWGKMDMTKIRNVAEKPRLAASDFLLKEAEISGMEHFVAMSPTPVEFYGIDNPEDYIIHRELFRQSLAARMQLASKIDTLRNTVNTAKADGSGKLRHLWKLADAFHSGRIGLAELSKALDVPLANYGEAEAALANAQTAAVSTEKGDKGFYMKNVVMADQSLELLARLFRQQLTLEEVQYVSKRIPQMLTVVQVLIPGENMQLWQDTVRSAIDHYAIALVRNKPMAEHARELVAQYPNDSPILVTGGFHTAGIAEDLKAKHISYIIIAPVVESQTAHDERMYLKRMMGIHLTRDQISQAAVTYSRASTVTPEGVAMAKAMGDAKISGSEVFQQEAAIAEATYGGYASAVPGQIPTQVTDALATPDATMEAFVNAGVPEETPVSAVNFAASLKQRFLNWVAPALKYAKADKSEVTVNTTATEVGQVETAPATKSGFGITRRQVATTGAASLAGLILVNIPSAAASTGAAHTAHAVGAVVASSPMVALLAHVGSTPHAAIAAAGTMAVLGMAWLGTRHVERLKQTFLSAKDRAMQTGA